MSNGLKRKIIRHLAAAKGIQTRLGPWMHLIKWLLCLPIALSAGFGYILYSRSLDLRLLSLILGMYLLAAAAAALNSVQERQTDGMYVRTSRRPLVIGSLSTRAALLCALVLGCVALVLLATSGAGSLLPTWLGIVGVVIYNGLYTPLKQQTTLSLLIGGLAGALPPVIGWCAAGGDPIDPRITGIAVLFYLWQIPHYLMVLLMHRSDYQSVSRCTLAVLFSEKRLHHLLLLWTLAYVTTAFALTVLPVFLSLYSKIYVAGGALCTLMIFCYHLMIRSGPPVYSFLFHLLNISFFLNMPVLSALELMASSSSH